MTCVSIAADREAAAVNPLAPAPTAFDLQWRLAGIHFRVHPSFWLINLLFGYFYVPNLRGGQQHLFAYLGLWVLCAFVSILVHELGHVLAGRAFGASSNILLYSMGGLAVGDFGRLARWQRVVVFAAGPAIGLLLFAFIEYALPALLNAYDPMLMVNRWYAVVAKPIGLFREGQELEAPGILIIQNLVWNVFNLIPIIPLDGGRIMQEVVSGLLPRQGPRLAYGFSFLIAGAVAVYSVIKLMRPNVPYPPLDPLFSAIMFGMMALSSYSAMRALEVQSRPRRYGDYEERDW